MPRNAPEGWQRANASLFYDDAPAAIDWLVRAFGFEVRIKVDGEPGTVIHSELTYGGVIVAMVSTAARKDTHKSPRSLGGANTQGLMLYVDDVDAHVARARKAGATVVSEPTDTDYGPEYWTDRGSELVDPEGHRWYFCQRLRG